MRRGRSFVGVAVLAVAVSACGGGTPDATRGGEVTVYAASSLADVLPLIAEAFEEQHPGAAVTFSFAGSSDLARQIGEGAPADVFAAADDTNMQKVADAGELGGEPVEFATNAMAIAVEPGNPRGVRRLADLSDPGLTVVLCAEEVPCGQYAREVLERAGARVDAASYEDSVRGVITKVALGEADAGIVYATDVRAAADSVAGVAIAPEDNVLARYPVAITAEGADNEAAAAFVEFLGAPKARDLLRGAGFGLP